MEEELHKRDFSNESFDLFLWYELSGSLNLIETELFMHDMELIPEDTISRAKELTDSLLTTGTITAVTNQRINEIYEKSGGYDSIISTKNDGGMMNIKN